MDDLNNIIKRRSIPQHLWIRAVQSCNLRVRLMTRWGSPYNFGVLKARPFTAGCKQAPPKESRLSGGEVPGRGGATEACGGFKRNKATGLNIPPRPTTVCFSHHGMPAHTLRCGLELSQEHSEERLDERDWVYSENHRPTVCLLIHSCWVCVCVLYV